MSDDRPAAMRRRLAVIVPARNEELNVPYFYERAAPTLDSLGDVDWMIVFTNNASTDGTLAAMRELNARDARIKILSMSRDFGYHPALLAGLREIDADLYAMVDVDCEDPPELLAEFYKQILAGAQVAYGHRANRDEPRWVTFGRYLFMYQVNRRLADSEIVLWMGEFCLMTKQVRDAVIAPRTTFPFVRAELGYAGFRRVGIGYMRAKRRHGVSHYSLSRMGQFAVAGILSGTTFPLRLALYLSAAISLLFPALALIAGTAESAAAIAIVLLLYYILITMPMVALYLARTYKNGVGRPIYIVDENESSR